MPHFSRLTSLKGTARRATTPDPLIPHASLLIMGNHKGCPYTLPPPTGQPQGLPLRPSFLTPTTSLLTPTTSLLTPHSYDLTPHSYDLTPHSSLLRPHSSLLTPTTSPLTPHSSLLTPHSSSLPPRSRKVSNPPATPHTAIRAMPSSDCASGICPKASQPPRMPRPICKYI